MPINSTTHTLSLEARVAAEARQQERDIRMSAVVSRRALDRIEGQQELDAQVREILQAINATEDSPREKKERRRAPRHLS